MIAIFQTPDLGKYQDLFPNLKAQVFSVLREVYYTLDIPKDDMRRCIYDDEEFSAYALADRPGIRRLERTGG